jgi:hypothetical protein
MTHYTVVSDVLPNKTCTKAPKENISNNMKTNGADLNCAYNVLNLSDPSLKVFPAHILRTTNNRKPTTVVVTQITNFNKNCVLCRSREREREKIFACYNIFYKGRGGLSNTYLS